jgi:hypothetical protein
MNYIFHEGTLLMEYDPRVTKGNPPKLPPLALIYNGEQHQWFIEAYDPRDRNIPLDPYMIPTWAKALLLLIT